MSVMKKMKGAASTLPVGIAMGAAVGLLAALCFAAVLAFLISGGYISQGAIDSFSMAILAISSALGALAAIGKVKRLRLQVCMIAAGAYYLTLLALTALFFGGEYKGIGIGAIMVLVGTGAVALLGIAPKKGRKMKAIKRAYR